MRGGMIYERRGDAIQYRRRWNKNKNVDVGTYCIFKEENKVPKFKLGMLIKKISFRINASFLKLQLPPPKLLLLSQAAATHSQAVVSLSSCCYPF